MEAKAEGDHSAISFPFTPSTLPDHRSLSASDVRELGAVYERVLQATPAQKKHRVAAGELLRLDRARHEGIPAQVASRRREQQSKKSSNRKEDDGGDEGGGGGGSGYLTAQELQELMAWKLARGVWRPGLAGRAAANADAAVRATTAEAFEMYDRSLLQSSPSEEEEGGEGRDQSTGKKKKGGKKAKKETALDVLCRLGGVGPATASLLLAVAFPATVPFFSDEIYYFFASSAAEKIRYSAAEYSFVEESVRRTREAAEAAAAAAGDDKGEKTAVGADDIERAAFVVQKLHNPDVWTAALAEKDPAAAIRHKMDEKDESKAETPTQKDHDSTSTGKKQASKVKKTPTAASGGRAKPVDKRQRSDSVEPVQRKSLRKSKRLER